MLPRMHWPRSEPEKGGALIESLSLLYVQLWNLQTQEGAISQAILSLSTVLIRLMDKLSANVAGELLDASDAELAGGWISHLKERQIALATLVALYETEQSAETRNRDNQFFQTFMSLFEPFRARSAQLGVTAVADDARNALINVLSNFTTVDASDLVSTTMAYLSGGPRRSGVSTFEFGATDELSSYSQLIIGTLNSPGEFTFHSADALRFNLRERTKSAIHEYGYRITKRPSILRDPNSPINQQPSGRHITFGSSKSGHMPTLDDIDPDLLMSFVPSPPFLSWSLAALQKRITFPPVPPITFHGLTGHRAVPFTLPFFRDVKGLNVPDLMDLIAPSDDSRGAAAAAASGPPGSHWSAGTRSTRGLTLRVRSCLLRGRCGRSRRRCANRSSTRARTSSSSSSASTAPSCCRCFLHL
jgi:hypothetical protein